MSTRPPDHVSYHHGGRSLTWLATVADGALRVQQDDQALMSAERPDEPVGWAPVQRAVWLNDLLVMAPGRARALAAEAGLFTEETP
jgi:hypothetical protein